MASFRVNIRVGVLLGFVLVNLPAEPQTTSTNKIDSNFHIYLLMGQSNMAGRGEITEDNRNASHPNVVMLDKTGQWVLAHHPLHFDKPIAGVGPGLTFAIRLAIKNPNNKIGIVPCAVGGTAIRYWQPGAYDSATKKFPYDEAMARVRIAMASGVVKGLLWHQGESDSGPGQAGNYLKAFAVLVDSVRAVTRNPYLPVVAGELGRFKEQYQSFNRILHRLPQRVRYAAVVSSEGLVDKGDSTHFSGAAAEELGERFADKMMRLQSTLPKQKKQTPAKRISRL